MSVPRSVLRRAAFALLTVYLVVSVSFVVVTATADPTTGIVRRAAAGEAMYMHPDERVEHIRNRVEAYRQARDLDRPVHERYIEWLGDVATFDWGSSWHYGHPVRAVLWERLAYTLGYLLPGFVVGSLSGVALGVAGAVRGGRAERAVMTAASFWFGVPAFLVGVLALTFVGPAFGYSPDGFQFADVPAGLSVLSPAYLRYAALPAAVVALGIATGTVRHAHNQATKLLGRRFVTALRAKGADDATVSRHVGRLAAPVLASLVATDFLGTMVLTVYVVEFVFGLPGFGHATLTAVLQRDLPLLLGTTFVVVALGVSVGVLSDLVRVAVDPR